MAEPLNETVFQKALKRIKQNADLHFKTHDQDDMLLLEDNKLWRWCYTHLRYEPTSFL